MTFTTMSSTFTLVLAFAIINCAHGWLLSDNDTCSRACDTPSPRRVFGQIVTKLQQDRQLWPKHLVCQQEVLGIRNYDQNYAARVYCGMEGQQYFDRYTMCLETNFVSKEEWLDAIGDACFYRQWPAHAARFVKVTVSDEIACSMENTCKKSSRVEILRRTSELASQASKLIASSHLRCRFEAVGVLESAAAASRYCATNSEARRLDTVYSNCMVRSGVSQTALTAVVGPACRLP